jgi:hypothetical protein
MLGLSAAACGGDSSGPSDALLTVSGSISNPLGQPIPPTARVVIAWVVSATQSDYAYVFGQGTVQGGRFQVTFREPPPAEALNAGQLGVGIVVLTTSSGLRDGVHLEDVVLDPSELLGATGQYAVIYKATDSVDQVDWEDAFPLGFGAGIGVDRDNGFDAFAPTAPTSLELIVDDIDNIDFVNWT